jgi:hypothetical protein
MGQRRRIVAPWAAASVLVVAAVAVLGLAAVWRQPAGPVEQLSAGVLDAGLLAGAPDVIKAALAQTGTRRAVAPKPVVKGPSKQVVRHDKAVLEKQYGGAKAAAKALHGLSPAVLHQMAHDVAHPDPLEVAAENAATVAMEHPAQASDAKVTTLEKQVKQLERVNANLAEHASPSGGAMSPVSATARAQKIADAGSMAAEQQAEALAKSLVPAGNAAMARAAGVAEAGAQGEAKRVASDAKAMLSNSGKFNLQKMQRAHAHSLPGVAKDAVGGVRTAFLKGRAAADHIPGIKEDTWPFAAGSFHEAKKAPIPGVDEDDWLSSVMTPKKAAAQAGGCYPGKDGKLTCLGAHDPRLSASALASSLGLVDTRMAPTHAPGTGLGRMVPQIRKDAEQQGLDDASAAFAVQFKASKPARVQALVQKGAPRESASEDVRAGDALLRKAQGFAATGRMQSLVQP